MALISFQIGLILRYGDRVYEFHRLLDDGQVQFEDRITKHTKTLTIAQAVYDVQEKKAEVLREGQDPKMPDLIQHPVNLSNLPMQYQDDLGKKLGYTKALRHLGIRRGEKKRIAEQIPIIAARIKDSSPPAPNTVMNWMRNFEKSGLNPAALVSRYVFRKKKRQLHPLVEELIFKTLHSHFFTRAQNSLESTCVIIRDELKKLVVKGKISEEESLVSPSTINRRSKDVEPFFADRARYGELHARAEYRTSFGENPIYRALQRYEMDHHFFDCVVVCDRTGLPMGRPTFTGVADGFCSYLPGLHISFDGASLSSTLKALKVAIQPKEMYTKHATYLNNPWLGAGIPEQLGLDNGLEFQCQQFRQVAWELQCDIEYCRVRTPWSKGSIERCFAELEYLNFPSGRVRKPMTNVRYPDPKKDAAIPFSVFCEAILKWAVDIHPFHINQRKLARSFDLFSESMEINPPPKFLGSLDTLNLIAAMSRVLMVGPGGIELVGLSYSCPELFQMKKEVGPKFRTVVKWDPDDMGIVYVQHPKDPSNWVHVPSRNPNYTQGLSWVQHQAIRAFARDHFKHIKGQEQLDKGRLELQAMWSERMIKDRKKLDYKKAVKYQGLSSAKIWMPDDTTVSDVEYKPVQSILTIPEPTNSTPEDIPDFDSFSIY